MTMHYLTPSDLANADSVVVGYDDLLSTFFVKVSHSSNIRPTVWVGHTKPREITSATEAIAKVESHAHIPGGLLRALQDDHDKAAQRTHAERNKVTRWSRTRVEN
ncbi:hypothetical protein CFP71_10075 [Amycolatopsis thailandensis]|uniref:Uncharacterized protein n=1 Tax=Amycolatopsis thailandensis TaxID=589330 RepID=A0A229SDT4_9PSEU|nr:hypothetical protein [Amycolatopsis thailandensis]OXM57073.1 hypothetical protein CFP71_10075 [Amycolatopsis thailandensis]